jgi:hypothetical protein
MIPLPILQIPGFRVIEFGGTSDKSSALRTPDAALKAFIRIEPARGKKVVWMLAAWKHQLKTNRF